MNNLTPAFESEDLFTLFELTPDLVCVADKEGYFKNFNPAVTKTLGYTREELLVLPIARHMHPEDREMTLNRRMRLLKGETMLNFQNRYITKQGKIVWLEWTSVYLTEKELVFAIAKNITSRKKMEQQVAEEFNRLKNQATKFKSNLEKDRKDVAAELHEEIAQLATTVRVDIDWIGSNIPSVPLETKNRIDHALITADLLVDTIKRISFSISPGMLDDLGLDATLEWYCDDFATRTGMSCAFESKYNEEVLSKEVRLDFFRICQEALDRLKKHAHASKVRINISQAKGKVILTIEHDGKSDPEEMKPEILNTRDRVASFGGTCRIVNDEKGTMVIVETAI
jgi:PAS domain S-box-containing protein